MLSPVMAFGMTISGAAHAQTAAMDPDPPDAIVVTATRAPTTAMAVPASVSVVGETGIRLRNALRLGDVLADVPGLYVRGPAMGASFPGSGTSVLSLRGIPRTPRTLVMIDGHPLNNALSGGVNVAAIPIHSIERVEVVRGPYSALYGGNSMGGVVNFISASPDAPVTELRAGAGSLGQRSAGLDYRKRYDSGLGVTLSAGYHDSDGYPDSDYVIKQPVSGAGGTAVSGARATTMPDGTPAYWVGLKGARPWIQSNAQLSLHYSPAPSTLLSAGLALAQYAVGYVRPESFLRDPSGAPVSSGIVSFADGVTRRLSLAETDFLTATPSFERDLRAFATVEHRLDGGSVVRASLATLRHSFQFSQATSGLAAYENGPGDFTDQPNVRTDFDVSVRTPMAANWVLVTGGAYNRSTLDRRNVALGYWRDADTLGNLLNAGRGRSSNTALFFQSMHYFDHGLTGYLGGRYDRFDTDGEISQNTAPAFAQAYATRSYDQFSPKLALVWEARQGLSLRTSYGEGFRPPALLELYSRTVLPTATAGVNLVNEPAPALKPERVRSFEIGADASPAGGARVSLTYYTQRLTDLIYRRRLSATLTQTENSGEADIDGIEASVLWPTGVRGLAAFGSLTHQLRYQITRNDAVPASVGKLLTDVPRSVFSIGVQLDRQAWYGFAVYRHVGHVFGSGDDQNLNTTEAVYGSYDRYGIVSAKLGYRYDRHLSLSLAVDNLSNRQYFVFNKQPGRTVFGELAYRF
ncbi:MAG: TonB-dependent receptor [Betaproteobacteria bacterium]|nr:TonB-dependent receptor [Betaproteobacteria bacterium]